MSQPDPSHPWGDRHRDDQPPADSGQPYQPYPGFGAPAGDSPPADVRKAFVLWLVVTAFYVLGALVMLLFREDLSALVAAQATGNRVGIPPADVQANARSTLILGAVIILNTAAIAVLLAVRVRAGKNWARIALTVLGVIGLLLGVANLGSYLQALGAGGVGLIGGSLGLVHMGLQIFAIILLYRSAANAYFRR